MSGACKRRSQPVQASKVPRVPRLRNCKSESFLPDPLLFSFGGDKLPGEILQVGLDYSQSSRGGSGVKLFPKPTAGSE
jgi:hypothetical protein